MADPYLKKNESTLSSGPPSLVVRSSISWRRVQSSMYAASGNLVPIFVCVCLCFVFLSLLVIFNLCFLICFVSFLGFFYLFFICIRVF